MPTLRHRLGQVFALPRYLTFACGEYHTKRSVCILKIILAPHQTGHSSVELRQHDFAHRTIPLQGFLVTAGRIEPDQVGGQVDEGDAVTGGQTELAKIDDERAELAGSSEPLT